MIYHGGQKKEVIAELPLEHLTANLLLFPAGPLKLIWDSFIGILIFYSVLVIPMQVTLFTSTHYHTSCGLILLIPQYPLRSLSTYLVLYTYSWVSNQSTNHSISPLFLLFFVTMCHCNTFHSWLFRRLHSRVPTLSYP